MSCVTISITGPVTIIFNVNMRAGSNFYTARNTRELLSALATRHTETPRQAEHGVEDSLSWYGARFLPFEGEIIATSREQRLTMERNLRRAVGLARSQSYAGEDGYRLITITDEDGSEKQLYAKVVDMPEFSLLAEGNASISRYRFAMFAQDPFLYSTALTNSTGGEASQSTTIQLIEGSLPTLIEGSLPELVESQNFSLIVENEGTVGAPPVLTVHGPAQSPIVTNETTGRSMSFEGLNLASGERLEIDTASYTATKFDALENETDASGFLTADSQWIFIEPGENGLTLFDDTPGTFAGTLEISFRSAWA